MAGSAYTTLKVDEITSAFSVTFSQNNSAANRIAVVRVVNECSGEYADFVFTQAGAACPANATDFSLQSNTTEICGSSGAAVVFVQNPQEGMNYVWEYGGVLVNTGNYMEITRPGKYTVYAGLLGCKVVTPQEITITQNSNTSYGAPVVTATNSGILCAGGNVILTAYNVSESVTWFHNGAIYTGTQANTLTVSDASAAGEWFAVQQNGTCGSRISNKITLIDQTQNSTALPTPVATVNGTPLGGSITACKSGTLELDVTNANAYPAGTIYEWFDNSVSISRGTSPVIYTVAPNKTSMTLSVQVSNNSGSCPNTAVSDPITITFTAPATTTINNGASTAAICGSTAATLRALNSSGTSYEWFKDGVLIPSANTSSYLATQQGSYTVRFQDGNGCWSPISTGITVVQSAAISMNWQVEPADTAIVGTQKSYTVFSSPAPDKYTWSSSNTAVATVTPIGNGSTASINHISLGKTIITVTAENTCGPVSLQKEIEVIAGCTPITSVTITPTGTVTKALDASGTPKTSGDDHTTFTATATNGSPATSYEWYVDGAVQTESSSTFTYPTPTGSASAHTIYAAAVNTCTPSNTAKSASVTVNITKENPVDVSGNYRLNGKTCFDVKRSNDGGECMPLLSRTDDFASTKSYSYTFININSTPFTNLSFEIVDNNSLIVSTNTAGNTFTVTFRNDINTVATGRTKVTALHFTVIAKFTDNTSADKQVALDVFVQDCSCGCTVKSSLPAGWLTFQCYNLGVPESTKQMTIDQQMATVSPTGTTTDNTIYGDTYQWGRTADGHQLRTALRYLNNNDNTESNLITQLDANGQIASSSPAYGKFVKTNSDWRSPSSNTLWYNNGKTVNDPCPPGWRIPTQAEWGSIFSGGTTSGAPGAATVNKWTWTNTGTAGYKISPDGGTTYTLFLPAGGVRYYNNGVFYWAGTQGHYWSSTPGTGTISYKLNFNSGNVNPNDQLSRGYGFSIRCVAE